MIPTNKLQAYKSPFYNTALSLKEQKDLITCYLEKIKLTTDYEQFRRVLDLLLKKDKNAKLIDHNFIKSGEYYLKTQFTADSRNLTNVLQYLKEDKGISIIPDVIESVSNKGGYAITVTKIPGGGNGELLDFDKYYHILTPETKAEAFKSLECLTELGIVNPAIMKDPKGLKIVPSLPYKIVCEDWYDLRSTDDYILTFSPNSSKADILNELKNKIYK